MNPKVTAIKSVLKRIASSAESYPTRLLNRIGVIFTSVDATKSLYHRGLFYGDIPFVHRSVSIGTLTQKDDNDSAQLRLNFVWHEDFDRSPPVNSQYQDLYYTPSGFAWVRSRLDASSSVRTPNTRDVFGRIRPVWRRLSKGTIIQAQHPFTYGDWTTEHLRALALNPDFPQPLVLPSFIGRRPYVRRELEELGINYIQADGLVCIDEACVLHKLHPINYWSGDEVAAYRSLFGIDPPEPRHGSIIYLSRLGVKSAQKDAVREYPSGSLARIVEHLGGKVVITNGMGRKDFVALAYDAETVIADHGAAMFNMLQWKTKNLIEIVTDNWWSNCFVFLGVACRVRNHAIVRCESVSDENLAIQIEEHLRAFGVPY